MNKKLCLLIPSLQAGGMERVMTELAWYFSAKKSDEIHMVLYGITREIFYSVPDTVIIHKPEFQFNNKLRLLSTIRTMFFIRRKVKSISPSSILSFGEYWNSFVLLSVLWLKYPIFISDRSQPDKSLGSLHDKLRYFLYPHAKGVILQTEKARDIFLSSNFHSNIQVIGNPVRIPDRLTTNGREKSILMVGRLIKTKHQDKLIEMFANVSPKDWKLIIVGYDHLKQRNLDNLRKQAEDLNIGERVTFTGKKTNVEEIYARSSIFAFTSSSEGFPNALGEAMASGMAVIAFDCIAGPAEIITDGYDGFLVPLFNYRLFEERLSLLINDSELRLRLGNNARQSIKRFSSDKICEAFYRFIQD